MAQGVFSPFAKAQIAQLLQPGLQCLADRRSEGLQFLPVDPVGVVAIRVAHRAAGLINLRHRFLADGGGEGGSAGAAQPVQLVLDHKRTKFRDLNHRVAQRLRIFT